MSNVRYDENVYYDIPLYHSERWSVNAYSAAAEAQKWLYLRSYPYRRYNKLILDSF